MANLISFYLNTGPDSEGRTLDGIWRTSDEDLMETHDVVQWLFPLTEPSMFYPKSPVLTEKQIAAFLDDARLKENLRKSFSRFMQVFGLVYDAGEVRQTRKVEIWMSLNHNWLRFTRILKSLTTLGLNDEAMAFFRFLEKKLGNVPSMDYWRKAVGLQKRRI
jgi:hypothetical protein